MILPLLSISPIPVQLGLCVQVLQKGLVALAHHSLALAELYPGCPQGIGLQFLWPAQVLVSGIWGQWEQGTGAQRSRSLFSLWLPPAGTEALQKAEDFVGAGINAGEQKRMNENKEPKMSCFVIQSFQRCFAYAYSQLTEGGSS